MVVDFTDSDEGKEVVDADGNEVGIVKDVEHGTAHVEPDPGITDKVTSKLGWGDMDEDTYPLQDQQVERVDDDRVYLQRM